jgi:cbb3-type cytochrome oxidase subunit 3
MMDWLATHGGTLVLLMFFVMFVAFGIWAYLPSNKNKMDTYGHIPLQESRDGE